MKLLSPLRASFVLAFATVALAATAQTYRVTGPRYAHPLPP